MDRFMTTVCQTCMTVGDQNGMVITTITTMETTPEAVIVVIVVEEDRITIQTFRKKFVWLTETANCSKQFERGLFKSSVNVKFLSLCTQTFYMV